MMIDSHAHVYLPVEKQIAMMNEAGIDRTILFSTLVHPETAPDMESFEREMRTLTENLSGRRISNETRIRAIEEQAGILEQYPSWFLGFGPVSMGLTAAETVDWINCWISGKNMLGLGEFTLAPGQIPQLEAVFIASAEWGKLPLWIHTFFPLGRDDLIDIAALSRKYPAVPVILGHLGGTHWLDAIHLAQENPNLYLDLSATFTAVAPAMAMKELPERTFFSSDAPYGDPFLARKTVERMTSDPRVRELVLGGNIERLLNL
jgi:predicted TIM-barrel fold metal-dependent hydrolase